MNGKDYKKILRFSLPLIWLKYYCWNPKIICPPMHPITRFALATDKPRWWLALCFPCVIAITAITALIPGSPTREIYKSYYVDFLPRVQTVDFNMLFHMLPAALSNAMDGNHVTEIKNNPMKYKQITEDMQKILNSNYGVFYLLVTHENVKLNNLSGRNHNYQSYILYETKNHGLIDVLDKGFVAHSDLILYPQPACATVSYPNPKSENPVANEVCQAEVQTAISEGRVKVLGRLHYIKGKPPEFWTIVGRFVQEPLGDETFHHFVRHNLYFTFFIFLGLYWLVYFFLRHTALQHKLSEQENKLSEQENLARVEVYQRQILEVEFQRI